MPTNRKLPPEPMRADAYRKLHEFNLHIEQGAATLREMAGMEQVKAMEVQRLAERFDEIRADASGYLAAALSAQEEREAGGCLKGVAGAIWRKIVCMEDGWKRSGPRKG